MTLSDDELRGLVREVIRRAPLRTATVEGAGGGRDLVALATTAGPHPSHVRFAVSSGGDEGACLIEPAVRCNHCGFCQSYGH